MSSNLNGCVVICVCLLFEVEECEVCSCQHLLCKIIKYAAFFDNVVCGFEQNGGNVLIVVYLILVMTDPL